MKSWVRSAIAYLDSEADREWIASIAEPASLLKPFFILKFKGGRLY
jgi:hypothetical protein